jgi:cytochrome c oxidase cbb3-type subunit III
MRSISICAIAILLAASGCKREIRIFDPGPNASQLANGVHATVVQAGGQPYQPATTNSYEQSAYAVGEGKRLYSAYNCAGCHAVGGGGAIGPALSDAEWIYGSHPDQIYATIVQGRGNGMPAFGSKLPDYQVWELAAYVRSLSGQLPSTIAPSRSDQMPIAKAEQAREKEHPGDENIEPVQHPGSH